MPIEENQPDADGAEAQLAEQRRAIDRLDAEILRLFNDRLDVARRIGAIKAGLGLAVRDIRREAQVFQRLMRLNRGGLLADRHLVRVFAALMAAARDIQSGESRPADGFGTPAVFALFGNPVLHSLGPVMHNAAFMASGFNGIYAACRVKDIRPAVAGMRTLGLRGASVTIPHKESVLACLDYVDEAARRIRAVNTIVNEGGALKGFNTDWEAAVQALAAGTPVAGRRVGILGAGGSARAVAFGVMREGAAVTIFNRSREKGEALAADFHADFKPLAEFAARDCDILVNTTPVGMAPNGQESPLAGRPLWPGLVVMDIVYNPLQTRLLRDAEAAGCTTIDGLAMFVRQGARQFELWTGMEAPAEIMRMAVEAELLAAA